LALQVLLSQIIRQEPLISESDKALHSWMLPNNKTTLPCACQVKTGGLHWGQWWSVCCKRCRRHSITASLFSKWGFLDSYVVHACCPCNLVAWHFPRIYATFLASAHILVSFIVLEGLESSCEL